MSKGLSGDSHIFHKLGIVLRRTVTAAGVVVAAASEDIAPLSQRVCGHWLQIACALTALNIFKRELKAVLNGRPL